MSSTFAAPVIDALVNPLGSVNVFSKYPLCPLAGAMLITSVPPGAPGGTGVKVPKAPTSTGTKVSPLTSGVSRLLTTRGVAAARTESSLVIVMEPGVEGPEPTDRSGASASGLTASEMVPVVDANSSGALLVAVTVSVAGTAKSSPAIRFTPA